VSTTPDRPAPAPLVLIVEDDELAAFVFRRVLTTNGYAVIVSSGDPDSLPDLQRERPAAMLIDLHLGEIDGLEFLRRLRSIRELRSVPAAVMTGDYFTDARVSREVETLGLEMYLKPLWDDELLRVVDKLVQRSRGTATADAPAPQPPVSFGGLTH